MTNTFKKRCKRFKRFNKSFGGLVVAIILAVTAGTPLVNISVNSGNVTYMPTDIVVTTGCHPGLPPDGRYVGSPTMTQLPNAQLRMTGRAPTVVRSPAKG